MRSSDLDHHPLNRRHVLENFLDVGSDVLGQPLELEIDLPVVSILVVALIPLHRDASTRSLQAEIRTKDQRISHS